MRCGKTLNFPPGAASAVPRDRSGSDSSSAGRPRNGRAGRAATRGDGSVGLAAERERLERWTAAMDAAETRNRGGSGSDGGSSGGDGRKKVTKKKKARGRNGGSSKRRRHFSDDFADVGDEEGEGNDGEDRGRGRRKRRAQRAGKDEIEKDQEAAADLLALCGKWSASSRQPAACSEKEGKEDGDDANGTPMTEGLKRQCSRLMYQLLKHEKSYLFRKPVQE